MKVFLNLKEKRSYQAKDELTVKSEAFLESISKN